MATTFKAVSQNRVELSPETYRWLQEMKERQKKIDERYKRQAQAQRNGHTENPEEDASSATSE